MGLINYHTFDPEQYLKVFDKNGVYLPIKESVKTMPKCRSETGQSISGIEQEKILEVKKTGGHEKVS